MATRRYDFSAGFESSESPSGTDPVSGTDFVSLSYANTNYALRADFGYDVASYAALKALTTSGDNARQDGQVRLVTGTGELWYFDADSTATDDGATILQPDSGSGRWLIASAAGASSTGTGGPGLEGLINKMTYEQQTTQYSADFSNSLAVTPIGADAYAGITGNLLSDYATSGQTELAVVWGAQVLSASDRNIDSTTSWTAVQDATTLTATSTAGEFKVGAAALKFNKSNTATRAGIRFDRGSANFSVASNYRLFFWIKLPSLTNLSNVYVRMYDSGTNNYDEFVKTTDLQGNALVADWNLMFFDLSGTPDSVGSSGWTLTTLSRYVEIGVTASSSAQTYTGIIIDSVYFGFAPVDRLGVLGKEHTIHDSSNKQDIVFDINSPSGDGLLDLASPTQYAFEGGLTSSNAFIHRSTLVYDDTYLEFNSNFQSGSMATEQEYRASRTFREALNGTIEGFIDYEQPENFEVLGVASNSITGRDFGITSGNCLSGDVFDVFTVYYDREHVDYVWKESVTLTGNATAVTGNNQIILPVASSGTVAVGDYLSRRSVTAEMSLVNANQNESLNAFSLKDDPNGRLAFEESNPVPFPSELDYWFKLGGLTHAYAFRNRGTNTTSVDTLSVLGNVITTNRVRDGMYALSSNSSSYVQKTSAGTDLSLNSNSSIEALVWVNIAEAQSASTILFGAVNNWTTTYDGWYIQYYQPTNNPRLIVRASGSSVDVNDFTSCTFPFNKWVLLYFFGYETGNVSVISVNGVTQQDTLTGVPSFTPIFAVNNSSTNQGSIYMSEMLIYTARDTSTRLFSNDLLAQINAEGPRPWGTAFLNRNMYRETGQSGQRLSMKAIADRSSVNFIGPRIKRFGAINI